MRRSNGLTLLMMPALLLAFAGKPAKAERPGSARQSRPLMAHEQLKVETARRLLETSVGAQLRARIGESAEAREFFGATRTADLRPETVDAVLRAYNALLAESPVAAQTAERELQTAITTTTRDRARSWLPASLVTAATNERRTLGDAASSNPVANAAVLRYAAAHAQRYIAPGLQTESNQAYSTAVRNIQAIAAIAETSARDANPQTKALGEHLRSLLVRASGNPESLNEMHRLAMRGDFNPPPTEAGRTEVTNVIRGFEMTVEMRDISMSGSANGNSYRAMAVKLAGPGATEAQIVAKETQMREADAAVKGNGAALEARLMVEGVNGDARDALTSVLRDPSKSMLDVMDVIENFERRPNLPDNLRQALANFKQYVAGQRFFRLWMGTGRLTGGPRTVLQKLRCLARAAGLTSPKAVAGMVAAMGIVFVGTDAATAQEIQDFQPVANLHVDPALPQGPGAVPSLVGSRPTTTHGTQAIGAPVNGGVVR